MYTYLKNSKYTSVFLVAILIFAVLAVYIKVLNAEFVYDDLGFIVNNEAIKSFTSPSKFLLSPNIFTGSKSLLEANNWRPISSLAFASEYYFFGLNPARFHLVSIIFHLINVILLYLLIIKITGKRSIAAATSSLWALHPVLTEAVSWVSNQSSLIFFSFFLLTIIALLNFFDKENKKWLLASYVFFALSLLAKETALGGIFIVFTLFFLYLKSRWKFFVPFILMGAIYFWARYAILGVLGDHALRSSFFKNLLLAPAVFAKYLSLAVYPVKLILDYSNFLLPSNVLDFRVIFGIAAFAALSFFLWLGFKKSIFGLTFGIVWFLAFLLPVLQIIPFQDIVGERFLYAPIAGLILAAVSGLNFKLYGKVALILVLILLAFLTFSRNNDWLNSENLWLSVIKVDNRNEKAFKNLLAFYLQKGDTDNLIKFSNHLLEINPKNEIGRLNLAVGLAMNNQFKSAELILIDLLKENPNFELARQNLDVLYKNKNQKFNNDDPFVQSVILAPRVEGNVVNSGVFGKVVLSDGRPLESSFEIFKRDDASRPFISIRTHDDGTFQVPLRPGFYFLKPLDPDGPIAPVKEKYSFNLGDGQWLQVRVGYQ